MSKMSNERAFRNDETVETIELVRNGNTQKQCFNFIFNPY